MSSETSNTSEPKLDLAKWAKLPNQLILGGGILLLIGLLFPGWRDQFYYSYLTGFMFFLSLTLYFWFCCTIYLMPTGWCPFAGFSNTLHVLHLPWVCCFYPSWFFHQKSTLGCRLIRTLIMPCM